MAQVTVEELVGVSVSIRVALGDFIQNKDLLSSVDRVSI